MHIKINFGNLNQQNPKSLNTNVGRCFIIFKLKNMYYMALIGGFVNNIQLT